MPSTNKYLEKLASKLGILGGKLPGKYKREIRQHIKAVAKREYLKELNKEPRSYRNWSRENSRQMAKDGRRKAKWQQEHPGWYDTKPMQLRATALADRIRSMGIKK